MVNKQRLKRYYIKEEGFNQKEAEKLSEKTHEPLQSSQQIYLALYKRTRPSFNERTDKEKFQLIYLFVSMLAFGINFIWLLLDGFFIDASNGQTILLVLVIANLFYASRLNRRTSQRIHEEKLNKMLDHDVTIAKGLLTVEKYKRDIFRAEEKAEQARQKRLQKEQELQLIEDEKKPLNKE